MRYWPLAVIGVACCLLVGCGQSPPPPTPTPNSPTTTTPGTDPALPPDLAAEFPELTGDEPLSELLGPDAVGPDLTAVPKLEGSTEEVVRQLAAKTLRAKPEQVTATTTLGELKCDEVGLLQLVMAIESQYEITVDDAQLQQLQGKSTADLGKVTVKQLIDIVDAKKKKE